MIIKFNPQRANIQTTASLNGLTLTYNGESVDLSTIPNGATASNETLTIEKGTLGELEITMIWGYVDGSNINCFPKDLIDPTDGEIKPIETTKGESNES